MVFNPHSELPPNAREGKWQGRQVHYYSDRIIVKFKPIPERSERKAKAVVENVRRAIPKGSVLRPPHDTGWALFGVDPTADITKLAEELSKRDDIEYAEPDMVHQVFSIPNDPNYSKQWALPTVNAPGAWDRVKGSTSRVLIGIIDSGISMTSAGVLDHEDLADANRYILGTNWLNIGEIPKDLSGHGTHITGIVAAQSDNGLGVCGVNWHTPVYICQTLDAFDRGSSSGFRAAVEEIVRYAVAHDQKAVINYSAGCTGGGVGDQTMEAACRYADERGMIICAAVGNDCRGPVGFPAAYSTMFDSVIAVGSTDRTDQVSDFSNAGPEVTVVAPGQPIYSTVPTYRVPRYPTTNYANDGGTSMAAAFVTGLVSLIWSRHPYFSNKAIRDCLISTARKLGPETFDNTWGYGRIDAEKAVCWGDSVFPPQFTVPPQFAIDPLSVLLPEDVYLAYVEGHHPHEPSLPDIRKAMEGVTAECRQATATQARRMFEYSKCVIEAIASA